MAQIATATDLGATNFPARKTKKALMDYVQTSLPAAGDDLIDNMVNQDNQLISAGLTDFTQNFIIAHSQGGLVSRMSEMLLDDSPDTRRRHYGIVTIGSPHLGARIVNSRNSGLIDEFAADACSAVLGAKAASFLGDYPFLDLFVDLSNQQQGIENLCGSLSGSVLPLALGGLFSGTSNDYAVGAPVLGQLQGHNNTETHKTSFYGVEYARPQDDPTDNGFTSKQLIWRMLGTLPDEVSNADPFQANEDQNLVDKANATIAEYQAQYEKYAFRLSFMNQCQGIEWFFNPVGCAVGQIQYDNVRDKRDAYHNALRWSQGVDRQWKIIIGAATFQNVGQSYCLCETPDGEFQVSSPTLCTTNPDNCHWTPTIQPIFRESDGVVTAESQRGFPGAADAIRMNYANHFQERNSEPTRLALLQLFDLGAGDNWFVTDQK